MGLPSTQLYSFHPPTQVLRKIKTFIKNVRKMLENLFYQINTWSQIQHYLESYNDFVEIQQNLISSVSIKQNKSIGISKIYFSPVVLQVVLLNGPVLNDYI